jgi:hypothetical protein
MIRNTEFCKELVTEIVGEQKHRWYARPLIWKLVAMMLATVHFATRQKLQNSEVNEADVEEGPEVVTS